MCKGGEGSSLGYCLGLDFSSYCFCIRNLKFPWFFLWIARIDESNFWTSPQFFRQSDATATDSVFFLLTSTASTRSWAEPVTLAENAGMIPSSNLPWWPPVARSFGIPTHPGHRLRKKPSAWWIYGGFIVDLPIENDDFMGFWYGILVWVTMGYPLVMTFTGLAMVKPWPCHRNRWAIPFLDVLSMVVIFHGELLVITRWYIKKETSKIFTRTL